MREVKVLVPDDVDVIIEGDTVVVKGPKGEAKRRFKDVKIEIKDGEVMVESKEKAMINTVKKHILNLIKGVKEGVKREMVIRYSHFPIKVKVSPPYVIIENFLGERKPRKAKIHGNAKVSVKGQEIIVEGVDIEDVTQTVANIRQATKIRNKDIRVFQDGIYPKIE